MISIIVRRLMPTESDGRGMWDAVVSGHCLLEGRHEFGASKGDAVVRLYMAVFKEAKDTELLAQIDEACGKVFDLAVVLNPTINVILLKEDGLFNYYDGKTWLEVERPHRGFYKHYKGDVYFVTGTGILDENGHGDPNAPRQVIYESTRSVKTELLNLRKEEEWVRPVEWPDGVIRPRFIRVEYGEVK